MSDVSGSMGGIPMEVSVALGLMIAQIQTGPWANKLLTFSENPNWFTLTESDPIPEKIKQIRNMDWGCTTNIEKAFKLILDVAVANKIEKEDMIKQIIILS